MEACLLLGEKEKQANIEVGRWWLTTAEGLVNAEEDRGSEVRSRTPGSKRDAIGTRGRVVGALNDLCDVRKSDVVEEGRVDDLGVAGEKVATNNLGWRVVALGPDL